MNCFKSMYFTYQIYSYWVSCSRITTKCKHSCWIVYTQEVLVTSPVFKLCTHFIPSTAHILARRALLADWKSILAHCLNSSLWTHTLLLVTSTCHMTLISLNKSQLTYFCTHCSFQFVVSITLGKVLYLSTIRFNL